MATKLALNWLKAQLIEAKPSFLSSTPHFNFISAHYTLVIVLSIVGSILVFAGGRNNIAYIDALFLATGASTQAGLNTVDINLLNTFQQVVLFLWSMVANPMAVNSAVVFLRLYWFEKRFQALIKTSAQRRGTISKAKSMQRIGDESSAEKGVNGRRIKVMHQHSDRPTVANDGTVLHKGETQSSSSASQESPKLHGRRETSASPHPVEHHRGISFSNTVQRSDGLDALGASRLKTTKERSDAILARQRDSVNDEVLHIPGPRDTDRGVGFSLVKAGQEDAEVGSEEAASSASSTKERAEQPNKDSTTEEKSTTQEPRQQAITIEEPSREAKDEIGDSTRAWAHVIGNVAPKPKVRNDMPMSNTVTKRSNTFSKIRSAVTRDKEPEAPYLSWEPTLGRNSAFPDLTEEQREELGGVEYRSLKTLGRILFLYFWGWWIVSIICLTPWILRSDEYGPIVDAVDQGRVWWGFFTGNSAFMDLGFTLTPDSMNSFNTASFPLLIMSFFIVIGNTGFPVMLRFTIWVANLFVPKGSAIYEELRFLLDHPRRCFTLLFPSAATWWLFWLLVGLNGLDLLLFCVLDLGSGPLGALNPGTRVLDGLFQATSTRTAGFSCVNLAYLHPGVQVSYLVMMYISVFPIAISVRRTNVYEEKSLGMYAKVSEEDDSSDGKDLSYVGAHLRRQLSFDLWYIFIGLFIVAISEGGRISSGDFTLFAVLFEIVSAYGTVGMSLGYPTVNASLSSQFSVIGKLVIIAMQIRGRHRGLPYGLDRAVILPSEAQYKKEAADAGLRRRRDSHLSGVSEGQQGQGQTGEWDRKSTAQRGRSRGRSVDTSLITSFLHPGPAMGKAKEDGQHKQD